MSVTCKAAATLLSSPPSIWACDAGDSVMANLRLAGIVCDD